MSGVNVCPACGGSDFAELIDFGTLPHSGRFMKRREDRPATVRLAFDYCTRCALLRQRDDAGREADYTEVSRGTGRQTPAYSRPLAGKLREMGVGPGELVIEVGANDGVFMDLLREAGFTNLIGIEPSRACAAVSMEKRHRIEVAHLDEAYAAELRKRAGAAQAIVCRHTLEHVPDPLGLLVAMKSLLASDGILFIEVPNAEAIIHEMRGHELWDEHLNIMTPRNLRLLAQRAGFAVTGVTVWPFRGSSNILLWARSGGDGGGEFADDDDMTNDVARCRRFRQAWEGLRSHTLAALENAPRPIYAVGASHPQSNYLQFMDLGEMVTGLVDDDPAKAGRFAPIPDGVPILSSAEFVAKAEAGTVLLTAFGYDDWMDRLIAPLVARDVRVFTPYSAALLAARQPACEAP